MSHSYINAKCIACGDEYVTADTAFATLKNKHSNIIVFNSFTRHGLTWELCVDCLNELYWYDLDNTYKNINWPDIMV